LRSPWSFLAKLLINTLFFGLWYFYDILQAFSNKDVIKVYGIGLPGFPAKRVAMGVLAMDAPSKKHANFFIYALCLFVGGLFGLDSFLVGDRDTGIIRLLCLVSIIGMPVAFCWWIYKLFRFFTDTPSVVNENASYFGSAAGGWSVFGSLLDPRSILGTIVQPFGMAAKTAMAAWKETAATAKESVKMGNKIVEAVKVAGELLTTSKPPSSILKPDVLTQVVTALKQPAAPTSGGGAASNLNALPYTLLGTIALIALSGFVATYYRSKKHVAPQDDRPPEPGVFRKPDSKERAA
jgi:TM2 domain-containing membrane protein YozV